MRILIALLALTLFAGMAMAAIVAGPTQLTVSASIGEYINIDMQDSIIAFGALVPGYSGDVTATDTAACDITTNVPLVLTYDNGSNLTNGGSTLELFFSSQVNMKGSFNDGAIDTGNSWSAYSNWGPAGEVGHLDITPLSWSPNFRIQTRAKLTQHGYADAPGAYTQAPNKNTVTLYK